MARSRRGSSGGRRSDGASNRGGGKPNRGQKGDNGNGQNRSGGGKSRRRSPKVPARKFWGDPEAARVVVTRSGPSDEPAAVVLSLGPPPFPGQEAAAQPMFETVYTRAAALAAALEAASDIATTSVTDAADAAASE